MRAEWVRGVLLRRGHYNDLSCCAGSSGGSCDRSVLPRPSTWRRMAQLRPFAVTDGWGPGSDGWVAYVPLRVEGTAEARVGRVLPGAADLDRAGMWPPAEWTGGRWAGKGRSPAAWSRCRSCMT